MNKIIVPTVALPAEAKSVPAKEVQAGANGSAQGPENHQEAYSVFEARDDAQVVDPLKGRYLEEFVYRYCRRHKSVDGKLPPECTCTDAVVGLSWVGVQEAAREYKGILVPVEKVVKKETEDSIEVMCEAIDTKSGSSRIGVASQPKKMRLRTGQILDDEFATAKALAKAQRNAIRPLLPVTLIKAWIEAKLKGVAALPKSPSSAPAMLPTTPVPALPLALPPAASMAAAPTPQNGHGALPPASAPTQPRPAHTNGNGAWHPSVGQVKRVFGLAFGNNVSRKEIPALVLSICGVSDPSLIDSREKYETLCDTIQRGGVPILRKWKG